MAYQFVCDVQQCLNCGACMDLCPPQALDMTRPQAGAEGELDEAGSMPWMMAFPVQTGKCTGCMVCLVECPVNAVSIVQVAAEPEMLPQQGPLYPPAPESPGWVPLSALTHETLKRVKPDPWGSLFRWKARVPRRVPVVPPPVINITSGSD